jgi:hypothetical protein
MTYEIKGSDPAQPELPDSETTLTGWADHLECTAKILVQAGKVESGETTSILVNLIRSASVALNQQNAVLNSQTEMLRLAQPLVLSLNKEISELKATILEMQAAKN